MNFLQKIFRTRRPDDVNAALAIADQHTVGQSPTNSIGGAHSDIAPSRAMQRPTSLSVASPTVISGGGVGNPAALKVNTGNVGRATSTDNRRDHLVYGNGSAALTPIEGAARTGYIERIAGRGFSPEYQAQTGQWQRNYEAGRQWATAILAIDLTPAEWPEGAKVPGDLLDQLTQVRRVTGSPTRPEDWRRDFGAPADDPTRLHAVVPTLRRGRIIEKVTQ